MSKDNSNGFPNNGSNPLDEDNSHNTSFVKKVKSRVSGLLPSSISKWFASDHEEGTKKAFVRPRVEYEDEQLQEPPVKRAKLPSTSNPIDTYTTPGISGTFLPPRSGTLSRSLFIHDNSVPGSSRDSVNFYNDDRDSESGESTSGYSSIMKAAPRNEDKKDSYDITNVINENQLFSSSANFDMDRSLFANQSSSSRRNSSLSSRRPSFNTSIFGSSSFVDRTLTTQQILNSPFYNGVTMYGGAAAHNNSKTPKVQVKPINETLQNVNRDATLSKTALRILNTLESYATDVNKMPNPLLSEKAVVAKYSGARPYIIREHRAPNTELQVPKACDLLKMKLKERLQDSTVAVRHIASTSKTAQDEYKSNKHSNKIKSKISSVRHKPNEEVAPTSNLPEVTLAITTLPKFDLSFTLPSSKSTLTTACKAVPKSTKPSIVSKPVEIASKPKILSISKVIETIDLTNEFLGEFKFADPLVLAENLKSIIAINNFKFSEPLVFNKNIKNRSNSLHKMNAASFDPIKFKPSSNTWECSMCLVRNLSDKIKCAACESPKNSETSIVNCSSVLELNRTKDKWTCKKCLVSNCSKDGNCTTCLEPKEKPNGPLSTFNSFKPPSDTWECSICMIRNKNALDKCAACETPRIGVTTPKQTETSLDAFKLKSNQWQCGVCMVHNPVDKMKCLACETPKPGSQMQPTNTNSAPVFSFGVFSSNKVASAGFPTTSMESVPAPTFTFGSNSNNSNKIDSLCESTAKSTPIFKFGLDKSAPVVDQPDASLKRPLEPEPTNSSESIRSQSPGITKNKYFESSATAFTPQDPVRTSHSLKPSSQMPSTLPSLFGADTQLKPLHPVAPEVQSAKTSLETSTKSSIFVDSHLKANSNAPSFTFNSAPPFSIVTSKHSDFNFEQTPAEDNKVVAPIFTFGTSSVGFNMGAKTTSTPVFNFNAPKTEQQPLFQASGTQPSKTIFGSAEQTISAQVQPVQNGMFAFGSSSNPGGGGFSFGATSSQFTTPAASSTPEGFNFGMSQTPSITSSGFNFGTTSAPAFSTDVKPSFNFTGGATPTFSAQATPENPAVPQRRRIRAVRRNPQR